MVCECFRRFFIIIAADAVAAAARARRVPAAACSLSTAIATTPHHSEVAAVASTYRYTVPAARHVPTAHSPTAVHTPYLVETLLRIVAAGDQHAAVEDPGAEDVEDETASVVQRRACWSS